MVMYYKDPDGTRILSANDKTQASQSIGRLEKQDTSDVDVLKQRVKELEDLLTKHNVSALLLIARLSIIMIHADSLEQVRC